MLASIVLAAQVFGTPASDLNWMAGYWLSCDGGREVSEYWSDARGGALFNTTINLAEGRFSSERAMIGPHGVDGLAFIYEPTGAMTVFPLNNLVGQSAEFENRNNDFPQRIIYARDGDVLTARIEGTIDGEAQSMEWTYQAAELNTRCPES